MHPFHSLQRRPYPKDDATTQPTLARRGPVPRQEQPPTQESLFEEYSRTLVRHRKLIASCALIGLVVALMLGLSSMPIYRTRTSLDIRSLNVDFMDMHSVAPTGNNSAEETGINLQTQIKLLQSDTLLQQVRDALLSAPHPAAIQRNDLLSRLARAVHMGGHDDTPYDEVISDAVERVKVKPLGMTRLVEITCDSWDPQFSARFCNTLTSTFEKQDLLTRAVEAQKTQVWLTRQVADVRQRAEESQKRLAAAVGGNGLMLSQTTTSAGEDRLRSLQDELVKAQADRMQKEAVNSVARSASPENMPDVQDNPAHRAYELKLADLRSQLTQLVPTFTEENPKVIKLRAQIADAEAGLHSTASSSTSRQANEYAASRHREELLDVAFKAQQAAVSSDLQKAAQVSLLRKELDSEQQLYQTLLQRAKEAGFASALQAATIRVIDSAKTPKASFSPRRSLGGGAGLALGGLVGVGLAFYRERHNNVVRIPGEATRFLHIRELGVIPAAQTSAMRLHAAGAMGSGLRRRDHLNAPFVHGDAINLTRWNDSFSLAAEAYRNTALSILLSSSSKGPRSYVVCSPNIGEGKTTITSNLGVALSKSKLRVVLVDGDLRRPKLHKAFAVGNEFGLRNILRGEVDLDTVPIEVLTHRVSIPNLAIIPAGDGQEDVVELLHSPHFEALIERLSREADIVLVDSPPVLHMADSRILAGQADGAILIFRAGLTTHDQAGAAQNLFDQDGISIVGTILNDFDPAAEGQPGYYASYYRYGSNKVGAGA